MSSRLDDMKSTILDLISDLKENVFTHSDEQEDLMLVEFFFKRLHPERVMQHIIKKVIPHKNKICSRNIDFFVYNKAIFAGLPDDRIAHYGHIITETNRLDKEDKKVIWEYFDTILELAEDYKKRK